MRFGFGRKVISLTLFNLLLLWAQNNSDTIDLISDIESDSFSRPPESWSSKLIRHLLRYHNKDAAPDDLVFIHYELELVHILGIDELKQTLTALVYVDERWTDPSLTWNPSEFNGIWKTWLPLADVWIPDVLIFNMLEYESLLSGIQATVMVYANGTVEYSHPSVYTVSCEINIKHFPLDDQKCALEIASWSYDDDKVRLIPHVEHNLQHYTPNEEWQLLNVTVQRRKYEHEGIIVNELFYEISVRRKPLFYFITVTIPSYVMCVITVIGVFARASTTSERIERFTLGVMATITSTSTAVLSLVVSEKVPHSSTAVPLLVAYFLFNMMVLSTAVVLTAVILRVHRMGRFGAEPPEWALKVCLLKPIIHKNRKPYHCEQENEVWTKDLLRTQNHRISSITVDSPMNHRLQTIEMAMNKLCDVWKGVQVSLQDGNFVDQTSDEAKEHAAERNGFVRIADRLDWFSMVFFLLLLTVPVVYLWLYL